MADDTKRCALCNWPLAASVEQGCTAGSCSYRPPHGSDEHRRIEQRRDMIARGLDPNLPDPAEVARERDAWIEKAGAGIPAGGVSFLFEHSDGVRALEMEIRRAGRPTLTDRYRELLAHVRTLVEGGASVERLGALAVYYRSLPPQGTVDAPLPIPTPTDIASITREATGPISPDEAREIAHRYNTSHWYPRQGTGKLERARYSIPANPKRDDDIRLEAFIAQAELGFAALEAIRPFLPDDEDAASCSDAETGLACGECNECDARRALDAFDQVRR